MNSIEISELLEEGLFNRKESIFLNKMLNENELLELSEQIKRKVVDLDSFIFEILSSFANFDKYNKNYDWNLGSTLQHFEGRAVINAFAKTTLTPNVIDSIGLTWVLGEFKVKDEIIIEYLNTVLKRTSNPESWWRAAFSLEQLDQGEAIVLLKRSLKSKGIKSIDEYFSEIKSKESVIGILLLSNSKNVKEIIYPKLKSSFLFSSNIEEQINCIWLLGRLKLIDSAITLKISEIFLNSDNYELVYYTCYAIQEVSSPTFLPIFRSLLMSNDSLLRKMAVRGLSNIDSNDNHKYLEEALLNEKHESVISEITLAIYRITNPISKLQRQYKRDFRDIENGLIFDDSDKWYADPSIYEVFSFSEDPDNICLNLILKEIEKRELEIINPIDLATGTGRVIRFFIENIRYQGKFYGIDKSKEMIGHLKTVLNRKHKYIFEMELIESTIEELDLNIKSNLILSSFGFPSKFFDIDLCYKELRAVYSHLTEDGLFITLGWDESFNDELNNYWYRHIPDGIDAKDFESWRIKRKEKIKSPRNCNLTWYKTGLNVPLLFNNLKESVSTMGYLFGRDAAENILNKNITSWQMSLGITINTKSEIKEILNAYFNKLN